MTKITVRLPDDLHNLLVAWARDDDRSLNSKIVALLRAAGAARGRYKELA